MSPDLPAGGSRVASITTRAVWGAAGGFVAWSLTYFARQLSVPSRHALAVVGLATATVVLGGWLAVSWRRRPRPASREVLPLAVVPEEEPTGLDVDTPSTDASVPRLHEAEARQLAAASLAALADYAPDVTLIRVRHGLVELLLDGSLETAPRGVALVDDGRTLQVRIEEMQIETPTADDAVVPLGFDGDGHYFAPASSVLLDDDPLALPAGDRVPIRVIEHGGAIVVEPFGLRLYAPGEGERPANGLSHVADSDELATVATGDAAAGELDPGSAIADDPTACADDGSAVDSGGSRGGVGGGRLDSLAPPGPCEVRVLREEPDLVGDLLEEPNAAGIEFVAYLALHDYRATTVKLRDALGTARGQASRSGRTVWNAASFARRALGEELVPPKSGNQLYNLSPAVTSDWVRFATLVKLADERAGDTDLRRRALTEALALIAGVPALTSPRYGWLDTERLLEEITDAVVGAACALAELELSLLDGGGGSLELAAWAIRSGRILAPRSEALEALDRRRAAVERDSVATGP